MRPQRIVISGNYGVNNLGDEAILAGLIRVFKSIDQKAQITVLSADPIFTKKLHDVKSQAMFPAGFRSLLKFVFSTQWINYLKMIGEADLFVLGGGGLFNDHERKSSWIWFIQTLIPRLLGKKIAFLAQSVGPITSSFSKFLLKSVLNNSRLITLRDETSLKMLESLKMKSNVYLLTDAAFALSFDLSPIQTYKKRIILSLRPWKALTNAKLIELSKFLKYLSAEQNFEIVFIPFQKKSHNDLQIYEKLKNEYFADISLYDPKDYKDALEYISHSEAVIGMRLHSIIFSILTTRPFVAISYSDKVKNFIAKLGLNTFVELKDLSEEKLIGLFKTSLQKNTKLHQIRFAETYKFFEHEKLLIKLLLNQ